jgi:hypothetical protein
MTEIADPHEGVPPEAPIADEELDEVNGGWIDPYSSHFDNVPD